MFSSADSSALQSHFENEKAGVTKASTVVLSQGDSVRVSVMSVDDKPSPPPPQKIGWRFIGVFFALCVINLVCAIDAVILAVALPAISTALNGTAVEAFWAGTSFLLTSTVFQPSWASFSHIIGRKPVLLVALCIFTAGTVVASVANDSAGLLVGRSIQGIGGGGLVALTYVIVTDLVTLRERGKWFALISLQWAIGSVLGPVVGGAIAEKSNWRWIFWLNFPFCVIAFVAIPVCLKLTHKVGSMFEKLREFDWFGSFLFISSLTSFLIPVTWGGVMYDWNSWRTVIPMAIGIIGLIGFLAHSKYISPEPLIRGSIFSTSTAKVGYLGTFFHGIFLWSMLYYLPLYYEVAQGFGPTKAGVAMFPQTFTTAPAAVVVGIVIAKTGKYRPSIWVGWFLLTIGLGLMTLLKEDTTTPKWIILNLIGGAGGGILYSAQSFAVQASASNADLPFAGAMYSFFRSFGQTFGVAVGGVIFQNRLKETLLKSSNAVLVANAEDWARDASALVEIIKTITDDGMRREIVVAYVDSLRVIWQVMCALAGVIFILSLIFTKDISLDREIETDQGWKQERKVSDEEKSEMSI